MAYMLYPMLFIELSSGYNRVNSGNGIGSYRVKGPTGGLFDQGKQGLNPAVPCHMPTGYSANVLVVSPLCLSELFACNNFDILFFDLEMLTFEFVALCFLCNLPVVYMYITDLPTTMFWA